MDIAFLETRPDESWPQLTPERTGAPSTDLSPILNPSPEFDFLPTARNVPERLRRRIEPTWKEKPHSVKKFVDDNLQIEKFNMQRVPSYAEEAKIFKNPRVVKSEGMFKHIALNAQKKGLRVNASKTALLVVSSAKSYEAHAHLYDAENVHIDNTNEMKMLGFVFNTRGDVASHIDQLVKKFRQKVWTLRHLRKNGFTEAELVKVYVSYMRPAIEYGAPIYHPMLSGEQDTFL